MSRSRVLSIFAVVFVLAIVALGIIGLFSGDKPSGQPPTTSLTPTTPILTELGLTIDNFTKETAISDASIKESVESAVSKRISTRVTLAGTVRTGSLATTTSGTAKNIRFIVDIPSIKQSYTASFGQDSETGESSLYILCPSSKELIYPSFSCQDNTE